MPTIAILHQDVSAEEDASEQDVLVQREAIRAVLERSGQQVISQPCTLNLAELSRWLQQHQPDVVFNLVESLGGTDQLMALVPLLLEATHIPFTGSGSRAILHTGDKVLSKRMLHQAGLPTPAWQQGEVSTFAPFTQPQKIIIKAVSEHASFGMDENCVQECSTAVDISRLITQREQQTGRAHFAEQFIAGREFNLSLLEGSKGPICLPVAEIDFSAFPADQPQIVGYRAKWDEASPEYQLTPRIFPAATQNPQLLTRLQELARQCWDLFDLRGYARVDFRVDPQGEPWILEINANPCLSPDAGFAAALEQAGIAYDTAVQQIVQCSHPTPGERGA